MKAAIFHGPHQPLTIENIDIAKPIGREVLVRTVASGVCHSDWNVVTGATANPLPAVLGHEGAGTVTAVGSAVTRVSSGDRVGITFNSCGACPTEPPSKSPRGTSRSPPRA